MNVSELKVKPCPFCGSDDISFSAFSLSPDAYALCEHCNAGIEIQVGWGEMTEKEHDEVCNLELQKVWNRRAVEQPQLNENQQKWINRLTINYSWYGGTAQHALHATLQEPEMPDLPQNEFAQVLEVFSKWVQEQEEE